MGNLIPSVPDGWFLPAAGDCIEEPRDLDGGAGGAASASIEIAYGEDGNRRRSTSWERGQGIVTVDLGFEPDTPGAVLLLLEDADGKVFTAIGTPLPPGDFAAG